MEWINRWGRWGAFEEGGPVAARVGETSMRRTSTASLTHAKKH
jgi:hypothetical protein